MNRQVVDILPCNLQNCSVPVEIVVARSDDFDGRIHRLHSLDVTIEIIGIGDCIAVAANPVAPYLVPNLPVLHVKRFRTTVGRARSTVL